MHAFIIIIMTRSTAASTVASILSSPSLSWLAVFVPALSYFLVTRFGSVGGISIGGAARVGEVLTDQVQLLFGSSANDEATTTTTRCQSLSKLLYLASSSCPPPSSSSEGAASSSSSTVLLSQALRIAQTDGLEDIVATTWRHDEELGRGYLLLSQSSGAGRVWRWEVGGGPFAIGKTLHLDQAGCRSNQHLPCSCPNDDTTISATTRNRGGQSQLVGVGGLAIDFSGKDRFTDGHLVMAEWGEGRIVRMQENGARTPLLLHVPNLCETTNGKDEDTAPPAKSRRLHQPTQLLFTPFGDLLILEKNIGCNEDQSSAIYIMRQAVHVPALESLGQSRQAHSWKSLNHTTTTFPVDVLLHHFGSNNNEKHTIGGMALTPQWTSIYVSTRLHSDGSVVLLQVPIVANDEDDDDEEEEESEEAAAKNDDKVQMVLNLTQHFPFVQQAGPIAVTSQGYVFCVAPPYGLVVIHLPPTGVSSSSTTATNSKQQPQVLGRMETILRSSGTGKNMPLSITSLTLGEDGYLYMSTSPGGSLLRLRVRDHPVKVPVNLVPTLAKK